MKKFFKLTKSRFILFLILITSKTTLMFLLSPLRFSESFLVYFYDPFISFSGFLSMPFVIGSSFGNIALIWNSFLFTVSRFLDLVWMYFIACLLVFLFYKIKNR